MTEISKSALYAPIQYSPKMANVTLLTNVAIQIAKIAQSMLLDWKNAQNAKTDILFKYKEISKLVFLNSILQKTAIIWMEINHVQFVIDIITMKMDIVKSLLLMEAFLSLIGAGSEFLWFLYQFYPCIFNFNFFYKTDDTYIRWFLIWKKRTALIFLLKKLIIFTFANFF